MVVYNLEERTFIFAKECGQLVRKLQKSVLAIEYGKQLVRSSGSVGANYIEANDSLGDKDFQMRIKICRKEAKESGYWLKLIQETELSGDEQKILELLQESTELRKIFTAILEKHKGSV